MFCTNTKPSSSTSSDRILYFVLSLSNLCLYLVISSCTLRFEYSLFVISLLIK